MDFLGFLLEESFALFSIYPSGINACSNMSLSYVCCVHTFLQFFVFRDQNFCFNKRGNDSPLIPILKYYQLLICAFPFTASLGRSQDFPLLPPCTWICTWQWSPNTGSELGNVWAEMPLDTPCYALPASCRDRPVRDVKTENLPFRGHVGDPVPLPTFSCHLDRPCSAEVCSALVSLTWPEVKSWGSITRRTFSPVSVQCNSYNTYTKKNFCC